jgi:uncharacterized protein YprB with RNaseH-like and TPR domain
VSARVLFVDIETQRADDEAVILRLQESVQPPGNISKPETIAAWWRDKGFQARVDAVAKTALDGTYGRLATVGYAFDDDHPVILSNQGDNEGSVLVALAGALDQTIGNPTQLVAFNGDFDFRFLMKRYVINKLPIPHQVQRALGTRDGYFDPMRYWEGYKGYISQAELEKAMGITRKDDIDGSQVGEAIDAGDWARVIAHNAEDIRCLRAIYRRLVA